MYALIYTEQYIFIQYFMYARLSIFDQKYNIPTLFPNCRTLVYGCNCIYNS